MRMHIVPGPTPSTPRRDRKPAAYVILAAITVAVATTFTFAFCFDHQTLSAFPVPDRPAYVPAPDPVLSSVAGLPPNATDGGAARPSPTIRTIDVRPAKVNLLVAGAIVRTIAGTFQTLPDLVTAVHDPGWISADGSTVQLDAALILEPRTAFTVAAPSVRRLRLTDKPGVVLGVRTAHLTLRGVAVSNWRNGPVTGHTVSQPHPSVVAESRAVLAISDSTFTGLGWDWNGSYGVSWLSQSTGNVTGSTFEHNFIGAYTDQVAGLHFENDIFRDNLLYGLDPHSFSRNLVIRHVTAEHNQSSGIIFSNHVTGGIIEECVSTGNNENGIMMDATSTDNIIRHNLVVGNVGDGIVMSNSPANRFEDNDIRGNRVGVHASGNGAADQLLTGNDVAANVVASQGITLSTNTNLVRANGGQWLLSRVVFVWVAAVAGFAIMAAVTWLRRRSSRPTRRPS